MPRAPRRQSGEARRGAYKSRVDFSRSRRRREDDLLALRRLDRDAGLFKRRRDEPAPAVPASDPTPAPAEAPAPAGTTRPTVTPSSPPDVAAPRNAAESEVRALPRVRSTYVECFKSSIKPKVILNWVKPMQFSCVTCESCHAIINPWGLESNNSNSAWWI